MVNNNRKWMNFYDNLYCLNIIFLQCVFQALNSVFSYSKTTRPLKINKTMGEMILWYWLKYLAELWAILWKHKDTLHIPQAHLIRLEDQLQGSNVWNTSCENWSLIQAHAFLNVWNAQNALFWKDSWKQLPPLQEMDSICPDQYHIEYFELLKIANLCLNISLHPPWWSWKMLPQDLDTQTNYDLQ